MNAYVASLVNQKMNQLILMVGGHGSSMMHMRPTYGALETRGSNTSSGTRSSTSPYNYYEIGSREADAARIIDANSSKEVTKMLRLAAKSTLFANPHGLTVNPYPDDHDAEMYIGPYMPKLTESGLMSDAVRSDVRQIKTLFLEKTKSQRNMLSTYIRNIAYIELKLKVDVNNPVRSAEVVTFDAFRAKWMREGRFLVWH